nr:LOB domain-containing protein 20-like [Ipomoea trifida]GMD26926.1 LOB domain-containing protein 20-like [Ipomoea batatas]
MVRPFSPPSTGCSGLVTSRNCCSSSRSTSASPPCFPSPSKLKQEWKTPFMAASPTSLLCNNRYHGVGNQLPPAPFSAADLNATNPCTWLQNSGGLGKLQALALRMTKTEPSF